MRRTTRWRLRLDSPAETTLNPPPQTSPTTDRRRRRQPHTRQDHPVDPVPVGDQGARRQLPHLLGPLHPARQQLRHRPRLPTPCLLDLSLQPPLHRPGLDLRAGAVVPPALVAAERIQPGVDADLPVAVAIADHRPKLRSATGSWECQGSARGRHRRRVNGLTWPLTRGDVEPRGGIRTLDLSITIECAALPCLIFLLCRRWSRCLPDGVLGGRRGRPSSAGGGRDHQGWAMRGDAGGVMLRGGCRAWGGRGGWCDGDGVHPHPDRGG